MRSVVMPLPSATRYHTARSMTAASPAMRSRNVSSGTKRRSASRSGGKYQKSAAGSAGRQMPATRTGNSRSAAVSSGLNMIRSSPTCSPNSVARASDTSTSIGAAGSLAAGWGNAPAVRTMWSARFSAVAKVA